MKISNAFFFIFHIFLWSGSFEQNPLPYKNPALPVEERVRDLLSRMTLEEKFWQLFMIPGAVDKGEEDKYQNGIFGFQVSATARNADASQQMLTYKTSGDAISLAKKINALQKYFLE